MAAILSGKLADGRTFRIRLDQVGSVETAPTVLAAALQKVGTSLEQVTSLNIRLLGASKSSGQVIIKAARSKKGKVTK
jgi:hypothetical protein